MLAYAGFVVWGTLFLIFPPIAYTSTLDVATRVLWMTPTIIGASIALISALLRLDLKGELFGLLFTGIGPLFYFVAQVYYVNNPLPGADPTARIALTAYATLPVLLILPRIYALWSEGRRLKRINNTSRRLNEELKTSTTLLSPASPSSEVK